MLLSCDRETLDDGDEKIKSIFGNNIAFHGIKRDLTVHLVCVIVEEKNFNIQIAQLPYAGSINTNTKYKYKVYKTHPAHYLKLLLFLFFV